MDPRTVRNEGSAARDHLANERTFLAWLRTALGLVGLGLVLEKLEPQGGVGTQLAALVSVAFGALALVYAVLRYRRVAAHLAEGTFPVAGRGPLLFGVAALLLSAGAAVYLFL